MNATETYEPQNALEAVELKARELAEHGKNSEKKIRENLYSAALPFDDATDIDVYQYIEREVNEIMQQEMETNPIVKGTVHVDGVAVTVSGLNDVSMKEVRNYVSTVKENKCDPTSELTKLTIRPKGGDKDASDNIDLDYTIRQRSFERIRRITGYLVGTIDRWNNAKRAEEHDRVKHTKDPGFSR